jgi:hypothetical protein
MKSLLGPWLLVLGFALAACGDDSASGGSGGSGGGSGGSGGAGGIGGGSGTQRSCPETVGDAPCDLGATQNDGLVCEYAGEMGCPSFYVCSANSATHGGWLVVPPDEGSSCSTDEQVCRYEDVNLDSGLTTVWTATCSGGEWMVVETTEPNP